MKIQKKMAAIALLTGFATMNCSGGSGEALVKIRNENKALGILCNVSMLYPAGLHEQKYYDINTKSNVTKTIMAGELSSAEKASFDKWGMQKCQAVLEFLKKDGKFTDVEIIEPAKVPKGESTFLGKTIEIPDYSKTRFDYIWSMAIIGRKVADPQKAEKCGNMEPCTEKSTGIQINYSIMDYTAKDMSKQAIAARGGSLSFCGSWPLERKSANEYKNSDFEPFDEALYKKCDTNFANSMASLRENLEKAEAGSKK